MTNSKELSFFVEIGELTQSNYEKLFNTGIKTFRQLKCLPITKIAEIVGADSIWDTEIWDLVN